MARFLLKACNSLVNLIVILALLISGAYAAYALWDNNQVLTAAEDVQADMIKLKPKVDATSEEPDNSEAFADLLKLNQDVCGWISMDNTNIDYPILHGNNNLEYINKDVYGNFALAGSIYLDTRNNHDYQDQYNLLYGHHMVEGRMFGDLDLYKDAAFFRENRTGMLILPDKTFNLEVISYMLVGASDDLIFDPTYARNHINMLLDYVQDNSVYLNEDVLEKARQTENLQLLALSTCSSEFTDARTIVLTVMVPLTAG